MIVNCNHYYYKSKYSNFLIFVLFVFIAKTGYAFKCQNLFTIQIIQHQETKSLALNEKIKSLFKDKKFNEFDRDSAEWILNYLHNFGTSIDYKIFDTYVTILLKTKNTFQLRDRGEFYIDRHLGERPKSTHFRELHWDWSIFTGYFRTTPSIVLFTKTQDLNYLKFILHTIENKNQEMTLPQALNEANFLWHREHLEQHDLQITRDFESYLIRSFSKGNLKNTFSNPNNEYQNNYNLLLNKINLWKSKINVYKIDSQLINQLELSLRYFKNSYSIFDLFVFEKYFDQVIRWNMNERSAQSSVNHKLQLTDWRIFKEGLNFGSVETTTDFIFQNSHDTAMKLHLLKIYKKMNELDPENTSSFEKVFNQARDIIEQGFHLQPTPEIYQSDLRIFTLTADYAPSRNDSVAMAELSFPRYDEVRVSWNPFLNQIQANVAHSTPLAPQQPLQTKSIPSLVEYFHEYFNTLRKNKTVSDEKIDSFEKEELDVPLHRSTVFAFTDPQSGELLALMRLFNSSRLSIKYFQDNVVNDKDSSLLPVQQLSSAVKIPDVESSTYVLEIGRVVANKDIEANSYDIMMSRIAEYLYLRGITGQIYLSSPPAMARYNRSKGAEVIYTPNDLLFDKSEDPIYVLKISVESFIKKFLITDFITVKKRH